MTIIRKTLAEIVANPRYFTDAERGRLDAMTEEDIEAAALADPDNPPWTDKELAEADVSVMSGWRWRRVGRDSELDRSLERGYFGRKMGYS